MVNEYSEELTLSVVAYARRLRWVFSRLGVLAGHGVQTDRRFHAGLRLRRCQWQDERTNGHRQSDLITGLWGQHATAERSDAGSVGDEVAALDGWVESGRQTLLLVAPFGSGKSVALETFAWHQAAKLLNAVEAGNGISGTLIPLPVRLRSWKWDANERFEDFLFQSQTVLEGAGEDGMLPESQFRRLLAMGAILPLIDGFDELPGGYDCRDGSSPRDRAMAELRRLATRDDAVRCRILLSSRPGYGAETNPLFDRHAMFTIDEYAERVIRDYIENRFGNGSSNVTSASVMRAFGRAEPDIRDILSRPLFLAAWCDRLERNPRQAPQTVSDIMRVLLSRVIDPARINQWTSRATVHARHFEQETLMPEDVVRRAPALGALLMVFADRRFGEALPLADVARKLRGLITDLNDVEFQRLVLLSTRGGFVTRLDDGDAYAVKVPVVEFLVGQFLAGRPEREFLATFRRWAWLPDLHDCLFFAVDAMRSGSKEQRASADRCCEWLLRISEATANTGREGGDGKFVQDDVLRPFVILAARLGADVDRAVDVLFRCRFVADNQYGDVGVPILDSLRGPLVSPYVLALLQAGTAGIAELKRQRVIDTLRIAGARVIGEHVRPFTEAVASYAADDEKTKMTCEVAIEEAAARTSEDEAEAIITAWQQRIISGVEPAASRLRQAIPIAARCIAATSAAAAVERWIGRLAAASGEVRPLVTEAAEGFAQRVPEGDAHALINTWLRYALDSSRPDDERIAWQRAAQSAATRVPETVAESMLSEGVRDLCDADADQLQRRGYTFCEIARRLPRSSGEGVAEALLATLDKLAEPNRRLMAMIVCSACERVTGDRASSFLHRLSEAAERFTDLRRYLGIAIQETASLVPGNEVYQLVDSLVVRIQNDTDSMSEAWANAIRAMADHVAECDAPALADRLMAVVPTLDGDVRETIELAFLGCLRQLPAGDNRAMIDRWVGGLRDTSDDWMQQVAIVEAANKLQPQYAYAAAGEWLKPLPGAKKIEQAARSDAATRAAFRLDPADAAVAVETWQREALSASPAYREYLDSAFWAAVRRLPPERAMDAIRDFSAQGEDNAALRVASYQPEIAAVVDVGGASRYRFFWRSDPLLVLRSDDDVETSAASVDACGDAIAAPCWMETRDFINAIAEIATEAEGKARAKTFLENWADIPKTTKHTRFKQMVAMIMRPLRHEDRNRLCRKGDLRGSLALHGPANDQTLVVDERELASVLTGPHGPALIPDVLNLVAHVISFKGSWRDYEQASHDCPACGAVHEIIDPVGSDGLPPQPCKACGRRLPDGEPTETPRNLLTCRRSKGEPLLFRQTPLRGKWVDPLRKRGWCPCPKCRGDHVKLMNPPTATN